MTQNMHNSQPYSSEYNYIWKSTIKPLEKCTGDFGILSLSPAPLLSLYFPPGILYLLHILFVYAY